MTLARIFEGRLQDSLDEMTAAYEEAPLSFFEMDFAIALRQPYPKDGEISHSLTHSLIRKPRTFFTVVNNTHAEGPASGIIVV